MRHKLVLRLLGLVLMILSGCMSVAALWGLEAVWDVRSADAGTGAINEAAALQALVVSVMIGLGASIFLFVATRKAPADLRRREALLMVALSWLLGAVLSALPYRIWTYLCGDRLGSGHPFESFIGCYFEAMSGLTTTGATVLSSVESLPSSLLLWRSFTHWIGGLGIVVLFVAVLPTLGVGGKRVFRIEVPGPAPEGVRPRIRTAAQILWFIYLGLTLAEVLCLRVEGLTWFDAVNHTFATLATGGFSTRGGSIGEFRSPVVEWTVVLFMVLAGINFGLYYLIILGKWRTVLADRELRVYLGIMAVGAVVVCAAIWTSRYSATTGGPAGGTGARTIRDAVFQVVSIQTTTGFCTADFHEWPFAAKAVLVCLMFVGASAGSTGGGLKVIRCLMAAKIVVGDFERVYRPQVIRPVRVGKLVIEPDLRLATLIYVLVILALFALGTCSLMVLESGQRVGITTAATATAATLNNIGPGLDLVGATQNYGWFSPASKVVMSVLMVLGRLEVYSILVLFMPRFWARD